MYQQKARGKRVCLAFILIMLVLLGLCCRVRFLRKKVQTMKKKTGELDERIKKLEGPRNNMRVPSMNVGYVPQQPMFYHMPQQQFVQVPQNQMVYSQQPMNMNVPQQQVPMNNIQQQPMMNNMNVPQQQGQGFVVPNNQQFQ